MNFLPLRICLLVTLAGSFSSAQYNVQRQDPFALLSATLKTFQEAACDGQSLGLECRGATKISIQHVQYGRTSAAPELCPPTKTYPRIFSPVGRGQQREEECSNPEALKIVEERCHDQHLCSMTAAPEIFASTGKETCPGVRKHVEVAYKCKPTQFRSKVVCHSDKLKLSCQKENDGDDLRLVIYSAAFASAENSHIYCPAAENRGHEDDERSSSSGLNNPLDKYAMSDVVKCEKSYATEAVMQMCHGRESCVVIAEGASLGVPACTSRQNVYLKTVFACVSKEVLKDDYWRSSTSTIATTSSATETPATSTEDAMLGDLSIYDYGDLNTFREKPPITPDDQDEEGEANPKQERTVDGELETAKEKESDLVVGFVSNFMSSYEHIKKNKEKFILFASVSVAIGLGLFLALVVWGMYRSNRLRRVGKNVARPQSTINAYYTSSPSAGSPVHNPMDIETEVGDHEVDTAFRDPAPEPLILAPPSRTSPTYGTLRRSNTRDSVTFHPHLIHHQHAPPPLPHHHHCDMGSHSPGSSICGGGAGSWVGSLPPPNSVPNGILRNSISRDSPVSSDYGTKMVRYSTIGRPRVSSPPLARADTDLSSAAAAAIDDADPRSLTLSRVSNSNADPLLYG